MGMILFDNHLYTLKLWTGSPPTNFQWYLTFCKDISFVRMLKIILSI